MAASLSSPSFLLPSPHYKRHRLLRLKPSLVCPYNRQLAPLRCLRFRARGDGGEHRPPPPLSEKKSFAVATGELFLGLASLIVRKKGAATIAETEEVFVGRDPVASVVEESVNGDVIWEQRLKDVEAEKERKKVTSPGFSFSAAGLLFPYHLGVAQYLLEKGYIKVCDSFTL